MSELIKICSGPRFTVLMTAQVEKQLKKADAKQLARCQVFMQKFCEDGFDFLSNKELRHEGTYGIGDKSGRRVAVYAFKAWALRVYGVLDGKRFIATETDLAKKQDHADRDLLESAARKFAEHLRWE